MTFNDSKLLPAEEAEDFDTWVGTPACLVCAGPLVALGTLGRRSHFRCRDCGMDQSVVAEPAPNCATCDDLCEVSADDGEYLTNCPDCGEL